LHYRRTVKHTVNANELCTNALWDRADSEYDLEYVLCVCGVDREGAEFTGIKQQSLSFIY